MTLFSRLSRLSPFRKCPLRLQLSWMNSVSSFEPNLRLVDSRSRCRRTLFGPLDVKIASLSRSPGDILYENQPVLTVFINGSKTSSPLYLRPSDELRSIWRTKNIPADTILLKWVIPNDAKYLSSQLQVSRFVDIAKLEHYNVEKKLEPSMVETCVEEPSMVETRMEESSRIDNFLAFIGTVFIHVLSLFVYSCLLYVILINVFGVSNEVAFMIVMMSWLYFIVS